MSFDIPTGRSPRYPRISLTDAIRHAKRLYDGAHRNTIDTNTAYRVLGYNGKTGASATVMAALRQYGLVSGLRGHVAVSDLALRILEPSSRSEYADAIGEAAKAPEPFKAILSHFSEKIPNSDEPIRAFLIRTLGFSKAGAEECISSLRETLSEAEVQSHWHREVQQAEESNEAAALQALTVSEPTLLAQDVFPQSETVNSSEFIRVPLSRECTVELRFVGAVTKPAIDRLIGYIELMRPIWSED